MPSDARPASPSSRARGHRAVGEDDRGSGGPPRGSSTSTLHAAPSGASPMHAQVAADVHTHADRTELDELARHQVGREPLADAARIEPDVERKADGALVVVDLDARRAPDDPQGRCRCNRDRVESPVIPCGDHRGKHGRIETATREPMSRRARCAPTGGCQATRRLAEPADRLIRLTSLSGMKRLHACSSAASRRRARAASVGCPPTTITWADEPITGNRISAAMALGVGDGSHLPRHCVVGTGIADQVDSGCGGDVDAGRRHRIRVRRRSGCVDRHPAGKAGKGDAAGGRDRAPRPSGGVRITAAVGSSWPCQAVDAPVALGDELSLVGGGPPWNPGPPGPRSGSSPFTIAVMRSASAASF